MARSRTGMVFLVGAGPGDPGLLTVRGRDLLRRAEAVVYDNLCDPSLLAEAPVGAAMFDAGKHSSSPTPRQARALRAMISHARRGRTVVRLKGGDPFVFGRGGEEAEALARAKIPFEIVPGVTSAIAAPAAAGIPVTFRGRASGFAVVTGHEDPAKGGDSVDYAALARFRGTLVFLMAVRRLDEVTTRLLAAGKPAQTPAALVRWAMRASQQTLTGTLGDIARRAVSFGFQPPAVLVVGEVVACRRAMAWIETRPLHGVRVIVTRRRGRAEGLAAKLRERGAEVLEIPLIRIVPLRTRAISDAARRAEAWDWIVFASGEGVDHFLDAVLAARGDLRALGNAKFAAVGAATAARLAARGLRAEITAREGAAKALARVLRARGGWRGKRILLPGSAIGGRLLEKTLRVAGARARFLPVYDTRRPRWTWEISALERASSDIVVFTSASTVRNFVHLLKDRRLSRATVRRLRRCAKVSIGPSTSAALRREGWPAIVEARRPSLDELAAAVERATRARRRASR